MKRRALSLLLALCLLLSLLPAASFAEEWPEDASAPMEAPELAAPEEAAPSDEAEPPADEEAPAGELPAEEPGEEPVGEPGKESTGESSEEPTPEEASVQGEEFESAPVEEDPFGVAALGSANVQYAGVAYLSQGAFNSLDADGQRAYVEMVDDLTEQLDSGVPLEDVVFTKSADGTVSLYFTLPGPLLYEAAEEFSAEAPARGDAAAQENAEEPEPAPEHDEQPEQPAPEADASGDSTPIEENLELAEIYNVPAEHFASAPRDLMALLSDKPGMEQFNTLFWNNKDYFKNQLGSEARSYFNSAEKQIAIGGATKCTTSASRAPSTSSIIAAAGALMLTYPQAFDRTQSNEVRYGYSHSGGRYSVMMQLPTSKNYKPELEQQARARIEELVNGAYDYAAREYPDQITYGIVRFLDDWLCANNDYDMFGVGNDDGSSRWYLCHVSYGVLLKGFGVCESYAKAMSRLLDAAGVPNLYAVGNNHAWNYVQMSDGAYYLQDSTWDDPIGGPGPTTGNYLLVAGDWEHDTNEPIYGGNFIFDFPSISGVNYVDTEKQPDSFGLEKDAYYVQKGETLLLSTAGGYYDHFRKSWTIDDPGVASINAQGEVTGLRPGKTTVHMDFNGARDDAELHVYQFDGLYFQQNGKASLSHTLSFRADGTSQTQYVYLDVSQVEKAESADAICAGAGLNSPEAISGKPGVAEASAALVGDTIVLSITPHMIGETKITVNFGGKSAKLTLKTREEILDEWFSLAYTEAVYTGKALKPALRKAASVPKGLKYSVKYANNTNAGEATVTITGKGGYGVLEKHFTIQPAPIEGAVKITDAKAVYYNGASQSASPTIKLGKKKLKAGVDYKILYDGAEEAPTQAGTYSLRFVGKNYAGDFSDGASHSFTIQPTPLGKLSLSLKKSSIKQNGAPVSAEALGLKLKYGKKEIPASEYEVSFQDTKGNAISAPSAPGSYKVVVRPTGTNLLPTDKKPELAKSFKIKK